MIVEKKKIHLSADFITENGFILKTPEVAYEEYGNPDGEVIVINHGGLSSMHSAGRYSGEPVNTGWWDGLIGPGKTFDTNRYRIISPNAMGSMYGTSSPLTINSGTGNPYGASFPDITMIDMAKFNKAFLDELKISRVFLFAGVSMGSLNNLQTAALYPELMRGVISVATAGRMPPSGIAMHYFMMNAIKNDPAFNNGDYIPGTRFFSLLMIHQMAKIYYTHEDGIKDLCWNTVKESPDSQTQRCKNILNYLVTGTDEVIQDKDPNCYIRILNAVNSFDLGRDAASYEEGAGRIKCPVLLINMTTDQEFPTHWIDELGGVLNSKQPGQAKIEKIYSPWGHVGCLRETEQFEKIFPEFIRSIS